MSRCDKCRKEVQWVKTDDKLIMVEPSQNGHYLLRKFGGIPFAEHHTVKARGLDYYREHQCKRAK